MRKKLALLVKALISLGLLAYLFLSIGRAPIGSVFFQARLEYFAAALLVGVSAIILSAYKWKVLLGIEEPGYAFGELLRLYLIGIYFNNFLPTSIGGDAARVYLLSQKYGQRTATVASVLAERVTGLVALILFLIIGILFGPRMLEEGAGALVLGLCMAFLGVFVGLSSRSFRGFLGRFFPAFLWEPLEKGFLFGIGKSFSSKKTTWTVVWTSLVFQFLSVLIYDLLARALSVNVSFSDLLIVVPLVTLLTLIPFSLNGLGIREGGFIFLLSRLDVVRAEALSLSLLFYGIIGLLSVVGGVLYLGSSGHAGKRS